MKFRTAVLIMGLGTAIALLVVHGIVYVLHQVI